MSTRTPDLQGQDALPTLGSRYVDVDALPWRKGAGEGIEWKVLLEDNERGLKTALIKWAPGASLPLHEHVDIEQTFVLEGDLCDEEGECTAGQYVWRPSGSRHRAWTTKGCLLLAVFLKPNVFLEKPAAMPNTQAKSALRPIHLPEQMSWQSQSGMSFSRSATSGSSRPPATASAAASASGRPSW